MLPTFSDAALSRLPADSRKKAIALDNARQAAHAALAAVNGRLADAYRRRDLMEVTIAGKIEQMPQDRRYPDEVEAFGAPLKIIDAEIAELKAEVGRAEREFQSHDCVEFAAKWLAEAAQLQRGLSHHQPPSVKAGADHRKLVEQARERIGEINQQIEATELAPAPADNLRERIAIEVDRLAEAGRPIIDHRDPDSVPGAIVRAARTDAFAIWVNRDALVAKLVWEVQDAPGAMTIAEKADALAELVAERLEVERAEEAHITAAAKAGTTISRRRAADARALLEIQ